MKVINVKKSVIKRVLALFIVTSITYYTLYITHGKHSEHKINNILVQQAIESTVKDSLNMNRNKSVYDSIYITWKDVLKSQVHEDGVQSLKLNDLNNIVNNLKQKYAISNISTTVSRPYISKTTNTYTVQTVDIKLSFSSISDQYAVNFINSLVQEITEYVHIISFSLQKKDEISKQDILDARKGLFHPNIDATATLQWNKLALIQDPNY